MARIEDQVPIEFIMRCRDAVRTMKEAGINDTLIACVVTEIRSAAISEEYSRISNLINSKPPHHYPHGEMKDAINGKT